MSRLINLVIVFCSVAILVTTVVGASFVWDAFLRSPGPNASEVSLTVVSGESVSEISQALKEADLIPSRWGFRFYVKFTGVEHRFQPGDFTLQTGMNYASLVNVLTDITPDEVTITFPEGLTIDQMVERIDSVFGNGWGNDWKVSLAEIDWPEATSLLSEHELIRRALEEEESLEGYLFPDTYRVSRSGFPDELTYKLLTNFSKKFSPELRAEIIRQGKSVHDVVTLASIIEKEVTSDEDRAIVADIFWRRLDIGMALQADSTVHFVVGSDGKTAYTSDVDRSVDSPYNTYKYRDLPPGPISNPSLSAINAVIYPTENNYWYFLTDADGKVHYAATNDEQNQNRALYLR
ncbi:MAG: endolytic transglycosylase MltG [Patescibacteria group bacterium]|jgi:UPF0755 protein